MTQKYPRLAYQGALGERSPVPPPYTQGGVHGDKCRNRMFR